MADVVLRVESGHSTTSIPDQFIDEYMPAANGEYVKVYIYLLRCMKGTSNSFSVADAADRFGQTEEDILCALKYWENVGLIRLEFDSNAELSGICFSNDYHPLAKHRSFFSSAETSPAFCSPEVSLPENTQAAVSSPKPPSGVTSSPAVSSGMVSSPAISSGVVSSPAVSSAISSPADKQELLMIAETYLGRTLNPSEVNMLYDWMDELHLPSEVIDYLIDYSITGGHNSFSYMDRIAINWAEHGISSQVQAERFVSEYKLSQLYVSVQKAFGISGRSLVDSEKTFINTWSFDMNMSKDLIVVACERAIRNTGKASFKYADAILKTWHANEVSDLEGVKTMDSKYRIGNSPATSSRAQTSQRKNANNTFSSFEERDYNTDNIKDIEKMLLGAKAGTDGTH